MYSLFLVILSFISCSDATFAQYKALGDPGDITCYSGGQIIYDGKSTGIIQSEEQSDGWLFMDARTNRLVRVSGDCVIRN